MLTAQSLSLILLRYWGVTKFSPQTTGNLVDSYESGPDSRDIVAIINGALQDIHRLAPERTFLSERTIDFAEREGAAFLSGVAGIFPPVTWLETGACLREIEVFSRFATAYSAEADTPLYYHIDTLFEVGEQNSTRYRLRIAPVSHNASQASLQVRSLPATITLDDLGDDETDPHTTFALPEGWDESILVPFAAHRLTAHPLFANEAARQEIHSLYQAALSMIGAAPQALPAQPVQQPA